MIEITVKTNKNLQVKKISWENSSKLLQQYSTIKAAYDQITRALRYYIQNLKVPGSNPTMCSAGL